MVDAVAAAATTALQQFRPPPPPPQSSGTNSLTEDQKTKVAEILAQYDGSDLSETDIAAINQAFAEAGITPSADLKDATEAAGFDPRELAQGSEVQGPPPPPPPPSEEFLSTLSSILEDYDTENLSEVDLSAIRSELESAGFETPGHLVDVSA